MQQDYLVLNRNEIQALLEGLDFDSAGVLRGSVVYDKATGFIVDWVAPHHPVRNWAALGAAFDIHKGWPEIIRLAYA